MASKVPVVETECGITELPRVEDGLRFLRLDGTFDSMREKIIKSVGYVDKIYINEMRDEAYDAVAEYFKRIRQDRAIPNRKGLLRAVQVQMECGELGSRVRRDLENEVRRGQLYDDIMRGATRAVDCLMRGEEPALHSEEIPRRRDGEPAKLHECSKAGSTPVNPEATLRSYQPLTTKPMVEVSAEVSVSEQPGDASAFDEEQEEISPANNVKNENDLTGNAVKEETAMLTDVDSKQVSVDSQQVSVDSKNPPDVEIGEAKIADIHASDICTVAPIPVKTEQVETDEPVTEFRELPEEELPKEGMAGNIQADETGGGDGGEILIKSKFEKAAVKRQLKVIMRTSGSDPFLKPVDPVEDGAEDYFQVVSHPMDLTTIYSRVEKDSHYHTIEDVFRDIRLVWTNCLQYNPRGSELHNVAKRFQALTEERYQLVVGFFKRTKDTKLQLPMENEKKPPRKGLGKGAVGRGTEKAGSVAQRRTRGVRVSQRRETVESLDVVKEETRVRSRRRESVRVSEPNGYSEGMADGYGREEGEAGSMSSGLEREGVDEVEAEAPGELRQEQKEIEEIEEAKVEVVKLEQTDLAVTEDKPAGRLEETEDDDEEAKSANSPVAEALVGQVESGGEDTDAMAPKNPPNGGNLDSVALSRNTREILAGAAREWGERAGVKDENPQGDGAVRAVLDSLEQHGDSKSVGHVLAALNSALAHWGTETESLRKVTEEKVRTAIAEGEKEEEKNDEGEKEEENNAEGEKEEEDNVDVERSESFAVDEDPAPASPPSTPAPPKACVSCGKTGERLYAKHCTDCRKRKREEDGGNDSTKRLRSSKDDLDDVLDKVSRPSRASSTAKRLKAQEVDDEDMEDEGDENENKEDDEVEVANNESAEEESQEGDDDDVEEDDKNNKNKDRYIRRPVDGLKAGELVGKYLEVFYKGRPHRIRPVRYDSKKRKYFVKWENYEGGDWRDIDSKKWRASLLISSSDAREKSTERKKRVSEPAPQDSTRARKSKRRRKSSNGKSRSKSEGSAKVQPTFKTSDDTSDKNPSATERSTMEPHSVASEPGDTEAEKKEIRVGQAEETKEESDAPAHAKGANTEHNGQEETKQDMSSEQLQTTEVGETTVIPEGDDPDNAHSGERERDVQPMSVDADEERDPADGMDSGPESMTFEGDTKVGEDAGAEEETARALETQQSGEERKSLEKPVSEMGTERSGADEE
eukprot:CAMPEP_0184689098 /NCGR_PEP_ID=MMETSP0312-20130426/30412_1 /TAXON_ID=31354 /ORGANISM="Compsopogon coeruleus, Strain SAG 36.94" /LENGTH=1207 /DNA_ID=CAMNT_0027146407 /DNA_START=1062 /DNA_END=4685 /DNA_ORIENTATION=-